MNKVKLIVIVTAILVVTLILVVDSISLVPLEHCASYYYVRLSILSRLSSAEASSFKNMYTLDDDFGDDTLARRLAGHISRVCPHSVEYIENGKVKNVDIHDVAIVYSEGPVK